MMRSFAKWLGFFLFAVSGAIHAQALDKPTVEKWLADVDQVVARKDVGALQKFLSPDIRIDLIVNAGGISRTTTMSRDEYIESGKQGMATVTDYRYQRLDTKIEIVGGGKKAIVRAKTTESMKVQSRDLIGTTSSTTTLEMINGKVLATAISGTSSLQ